MRVSSWPSTRSRAKCLVVTRSQSPQTDPWAPLTALSPLAAQRPSPSAPLTPAASAAHAHPREGTKPEFSRPPAPLAARVRARCGPSSTQSRPVAICGGPGLARFLPVRNLAWHAACGPLKPCARAPAIERRGGSPVFPATPAGESGPQRARNRAPGSTAPQRERRRTWERLSAGPGWLSASGATRQGRRCRGLPAHPAQPRIPRVFAQLRI